jgi:hypothetical protein
MPKIIVQWEQVECGFMKLDNWLAKVVSPVETVTYASVFRTIDGLWKVNFTPMGRGIDRPSTCIDYPTGREKSAKDSSLGRLLPISRPTRLPPLRKMETIAQAAHGPKVSRVVLVYLDLVANSLYVNIDNAGINLPGTGAHYPKKVIPAERATRVSDEVIQQSKLAQRNLNRHVFDCQGYGIRVYFHVSESELRSSAKFVIPSQTGHDSGD